MSGTLSILSWKDNDSPRGLAARVVAVRHLRESIMEPSADIPLDYRTVEVISITGKSSSGIHLNEDEYSIHLRDMKGDLRSFMKSELKEIKLPRESLMPDYASLSKDDLENLVGYLGSLQKRGPQ